MHLLFLSIHLPAVRPEQRGEEKFLAYHLTINIMKLPHGYNTVMPYLILKETAQFIEFSKKVFGAKELSLHCNGDGSMMHAEIQIGGSTIMIGESKNEWPVQNASLFINVEDADETFTKAIASGSETVMPLDNKDYGRSGGIKDPFGNTWWITTPPAV